MPSLPDTIAPILDNLSRFPDAEGRDLHGFDGVDRLLLEESLDDIAPDEVGGPAEGDRRVVVLDDEYGALTLGAITLGAWDVRVHQDSLTGVRALANNARRLGISGYVSIDPPAATAGMDGTEVLGAELLAGADVVLLRLPKSHDALAEMADAIARHASPGVVVHAGGRVKHMSRGMNDVLAASFGDVRAGLGRYKSRVLTARGPLPVPEQPAFPRSERLDELDLTVLAHGGVFAGTRLDLGTRFLLDFLPRMDPDARDAVDLGCGTGILATMLARTLPDLRIVASDTSAVAVASAAATASANGVGDRVSALRDDALASLPTASADLVVCNPPFHTGTTVHTAAAQRMFDAAGRVLRPGGEMWTVYNSHLTYKRDLSRAVGPTTMIGQNVKFTVTRSVKSAVR